MGIKETNLFKVVMDIKTCPNKVVIHVAANTFDEVRQILAIKDATCLKDIKGIIPVTGLVLTLEP